jgi:hypothetical protein
MTRQMINPIMDVTVKTIANTGMMGPCKSNPRKTSASGAAKNRASAMRPIIFKLRGICGSNNSNHGARTSQAITRGRNAAAMRGRYSNPPSPWVIKPTMVTIARARISPRIRIFLCFIFHVVGAQRCRALTLPCVRPGTTRLHESNAC